eukprot:jgi/Tetstr1/453680/TSEL_040636.t1
MAFQHSVASTRALPSRPALGGAECARLRQPLRGAPSCPHRLVAAAAGSDRSESGRADGPALSRRAGLAAALVTGSQLLRPSDAGAFGRDYPMEILSYDLVECKPNTYVPKRKGFKCMNVRGKAKVTGKDMEAADVFGFVTDASNNSALAVNPDGSSRTVVAGIKQPMKGGGTEVEVEFTLVVSEKALADPPLKFKAFKMTPSVGLVEDRFAPFSDCEMDLSAEGCT